MGRTDKNDLMSKIVTREMVQLTGGMTTACQYLLVSFLTPFCTIQPSLACGNYISPNSFQFHIYHLIQIRSFQSHVHLI